MSGIQEQLAAFLNNPNKKFFSIDTSKLSIMEKIQYHEFQEVIKQHSSKAEKLRITRDPVYLTLQEIIYYVKLSIHRYRHYINQDSPAEMISSKKSPIRVVQCRGQLCVQYQYDENSYLVVVSGKHRCFERNQRFPCYKRIISRK